jgi:uncharacterized membrane protein (UPF0182 family)
MMMQRQNFFLILLLVAIVLAISFSTLIHLLTESWWFEAVGFQAVFQTQLLWQIGLALGTFLIYSLFIGLNYQVAMALSQNRPFSVIVRGQFRTYGDEIVHGAVLLGTLVIALWATGRTLPNWTMVLRFFNATSVGTIDPVYQQDLGFYLFQLPFWESLHQWLVYLGVSGLGVALLVYFLKGLIPLGRGWRNGIYRNIPIHLGILLTALILLGSVHFWLERYELLYSPSGVVFGAGYADLHGRLAAYWIMSFATLALGGLLLISFWRSSALLFYGVLMYLGIWILAMEVYPGLQQQFEVEPNELTKEAPYIVHNINLTRSAYQLDQVQRQDYQVQNALNRSILEANQSTIDNIRLWDYRPLLDTYRQLQELRPYYRFHDVDVDRYAINGVDRQVMISSRELEVNDLTARTWVNQRLKYTHGYGIAMSPVDRVTPDGLPEFFIKDIPPKSNIDLQLDQSALYYGELTRDYIFTGTSTDEFDYPLGDENAAVRYQGTGGVPLSNLWRRLAYTLDLGSFKILISNYFTPESRIHYHRQIQERIHQVAPFLYLDQDPYIAVINNRLQWIIDGYTLSNRYPYSEPLVLVPGATAVFPGAESLRLLQGQVNYICNSVKIVVDAYDGTMQFYGVDDTDPILQTYRKIFPTLFTAQDQIPPEVSFHFRYPVDLFKIQALMYLAYHMDNPEVFYNQEDLWSFPTEVFDGQQQITEPYYVIMRLPDESQPEMMLILPFTPTSKNNMIAWMAARSDQKNYGKVLLYEFPKQALVYGPSQIEARVDQTPEISQQLTLWSQQGSRVIRGNLLVIPIERSILYVEPIYLRAEKGQLPELKRVIVAYNDRVVMEPTLTQAITTVFGEPSAKPTPESSPEPPVSTPSPTSPELSALVDKALKTYQKAQDALRQGNWADYGRYQQELEKLLKEIDRKVSLL